MAKAKSPIPEGFHTVTPQLTLDNCANAIDWYKKALGAQEISRAVGPDEPLEPKLGTLGMIIDQDVAHMAAMQKGLKSCERGLVLAEYQESRIRHYHRTLTNYINA